MKTSKLIAAVSAVLTSACAFSQVPDLLNAFDAGGSAMAAGGTAFYQTGVDTLSAYYNPAGLAYLKNRSAGLVYRNKPGSNTVATGSFPSPNLSSTGTRGTQTLTHAGFSIPGEDLSKGRWKGNFAIAYTIGGTLDDQTIGGQNLTYNSQQLNNYTLNRSVETSFITFGYGWTTGKKQDTAWGIGLNYITNRVAYSQTGSVNDGNGGQTTIFNSNVSGTPKGLAATIGVLKTPNANTSFGLSYRSEAKLSGGGSSAGVYDRIPAKLSAGAVFRAETKQDNYVLFGLGADHFFKANNSSLFERKAYTSVSGGFELNLFSGDNRIPIRLGYVSIPSGGTDFGSRSGLTYGFGFHPANGKFGLDISLAAPRTSSDLSIALTYKFDQ